MTYYLFYDRGNGELYAYTDKKEYASLFSIWRKEKLFIQKQKKLSSKDLKNIHDNCPDTILRMYKFDLEDREFEMPITMREEMAVEHVLNYTKSVTLGMVCTKLPIDIFTKDMQDILDDVGYIGIRNEYLDPHSKMVPMKPKYLSTFLYLYGNTMKGDIE